MRKRFFIPGLTAVALLACVTALAQQATRPLAPSRKTVWSLVLGAPLAAQPGAPEFRAYACGSKGGPPRARLENFGEFARCAPEPDGLHEVYFEYDDELEYIARARNLPYEINRWAGTVEMTYPLVVSALFNAQGELRGVRLVTDSRPDARIEVNAADRASRAEAYLLGAKMAARFDIDGQRDCRSAPPATGESPVGSLFVKLDCNKLDAGAGRRYVLQVRMLRKPGQSDRDPRVPSQLTTGQFESSARLEIYVAP